VVEGVPLVRSRGAFDESSFPNNDLVGSAGDAAVDEASARAQLRRILESPDFGATTLGRKLLSYVIQEKLEGRGDRIKAYSIATEAFGRHASFDAHSDPIVRVEAGHLRRALAHYYLAAGKTDPVVITVPKGGYIPVFGTWGTHEAVASIAQVPARQRALPVSLVALAAFALASLVLAWLVVERMPGARQQRPDVPRLLVKPFEDLTKTGNSPAIARGLTEEIIGQIAKFKDIVTIEAGPDAEPPSRARFALTGSVSIGDDRIHLQARVLTLAGGSVLWANSYEGDLRTSKLIEIEHEFAREIATTLGQPYGVIFRADASQTRLDTPDDWDAYSCTLSYYAYRANLDPNTFQDVRKCLEATVGRYPAYATAWAMLSQTYVDEVRFGYPAGSSSSPTTIDRALEAARRATELDPDNVRGLQAEMLALYFSGDIGRALQTGERALSVNPNDTDLVGEYGLRLALSGDWTRGCSLIREARDRNPGPLNYYEADLALCSYFRKDYREATMWIKKAALPDNPAYHLIAAVIFGESGQTADAASERDWLMTHRPKLVANIRAEIAMRLARPEDVERVLKALGNAGLPIPSESPPLER
jgi:TolB-like protein